MAAMNIIWVIMKAISIKKVCNTEINAVHFPQLIVRLIGKFFDTLKRTVCIIGTKEADSSYKCRKAGAKAL